MLVTILKFVGLMIGAYLLGGVMFAKIISRSRKKNSTITDVGSGNPGTINMIRNHGLLLGTLTFILDALKGAIPAIVAYFVFGGAEGELARVALYVVGTCAVLGHCFPIYFKFKGGKGVATTFGMMVVAQPIVCACLLVVFILVFAISRIGSLGSIVCAILYMIIDSILLIKEANYIGLGCMYFVLLLVILKHHENIKRLFHKKENAIDFNAAIQKDNDLINEIKDKHKNKTSANPIKIESVEKVDSDKETDNTVEDDKTEGNMTNKKENIANTETNNIEKETKQNKDDNKK